MKPALATQLLVIGGGATGLGVAWDSCLRGIKTVVIEQSDLAQGTSGRYHGLLHSGGRYVISDPQSAQECAHENQILRRIIPAAIEPTGGMFVSTPPDPPEFSDRWILAAHSLGLPAEEIEPSQALKLEPNLNPQIRRAFSVQDASLDSFDLLHALARSIQQAGGEVWLQHRLEKIESENGHVTRAIIHDLRSNRRFSLVVEAIVNAAGPWAGKVAHLAGIDLPLALGKGVMVAMAQRPVRQVLNRCKPPSDGDIIVPVGTVAVLGTTDEPVSTPTSLDIEPWEVELITAEGDILVPGMLNQRPLRAWAGIRPLYQPRPSQQLETRNMTRAHVIIDHGAEDGCSGFFSVFGGKLTTFRLMAQETVDRVCQQYGWEGECRTADTPLVSPEKQSFYRLDDRPRELSERKHSNAPSALACECEMVLQSQIEKALQRDPLASLDDLRRDLRLGMGPCQGSFCSYRAAGIAYRLLEKPPAETYLVDFLNERWRGVRPLAWGNNLRQMELMRRIYIETLGVKTQDRIEE